MVATRSPTVFACALPRRVLDLLQAADRNTRVGITFGDSGNVMQVGSVQLPFSVASIGNSLQEQTMRVAIASLQDSSKYTIYGPIAHTIVLQEPKNTSAVVLSASADWQQSSSNRQRQVASKIRSPERSMHKTRTTTVSEETVYDVSRSRKEPIVSSKKHSSTSARHNASDSTQLNARARIIASYQQAVTAKVESLSSTPVVSSNLPKAPISPNLQPPITTSSSISPSISASSSSPPVLSATTALSSATTTKSAIVTTTTANRRDLSQKQVTDRSLKRRLIQLLLCQPLVMKDLVKQLSATKDEIVAVLAQIGQPAGDRTYDLRPVYFNNGKTFDWTYGIQDNGTVNNRTFTEIKSVPISQNLKLPSPSPSSSSIIEVRKPNPSDTQPIKNSTLIVAKFQKSRQISSRSAQGSTSPDNLLTVQPKILSRSLSSSDLTTFKPSTTQESGFKSDRIPYNGTSDIEPRQRSKTEQSTRPLSTTSITTTTVTSNRPISSTRTVPRIARVGHTSIVRASSPLSRPHSASETQSSGMTTTVQSQKVSTNQRKPQSINNSADTITLLQPQSKPMEAHRQDNVSSSRKRKVSSAGWNTSMSDDVVSSGASSSTSSRTVRHRVTSDSGLHSTSAESASKVNMKQKLSQSRDYNHRRESSHDSERHTIKTKQSEYSTRGMSYTDNCLDRSKTLSSTSTKLDSFTRPTSSNKPSTPRSTTQSSNSNSSKTMATADNTSSSSTSKLNSRRPSAAFRDSLENRYHEFIHLLDLITSARTDLIAAEFRPMSDDSNANSHGNRSITESTTTTEFMGWVTRLQQLHTELTIIKSHLNDI